MYKLTNSSSVIRLSDGAYIPADENNRDYQAYLQWLEEGNTPEPADIPEPQVPQVISKYQGIAQLHIAGLLPSVKAIMADEATDPLTVIAWDNVQEFRRESPMIAEIAGALGITDEQLDQMFTDAAKIIA